MIKLSRMTDYAVVVLSELAGRRDGVQTAARISDRTGIPEPTVAKVLKSLVPAGLVASQRGATGGYSLARAPERITVADIVAALDGPIALTACVTGGDGGCSAEGLCPMRGNWERVNQAIRGALESVSLIDMMPTWMPARTGAGIAGNGIAADGADGAWGGPPRRGATGSAAGRVAG